MAQNLDKQVITSDAKYLREGNEDYCAYPYHFFQTAMVSTGTVGASRPIAWVDGGYVDRRRTDPQYVTWPSVFFASYISLKTVPWLLGEQPVATRRRPWRDHEYPSVFFTSFKSIAPGSAATGYVGSQISVRVDDPQRRWKPQTYPAIFAKPAKVPDTAFVSGDWTGGQDAEHTWTRVD